MAGAYCQFCDHRCFVLRAVPGHGHIHMATCGPGMAHDERVTGYTHATAVNPVTGRPGGDRDAPVRDY